MSARIADLATATACPSIDYIAFGASVPACFERAAGLYPNRIAVHCRLGEITYADLNAAANRLAHRILESGGRVGDRVALLMPQDRRIFIAMLAALKAGRIVVVLNGQDPQARIAQLVDDADPALIMTIDSCLEQAMEFAGARLRVIDVDAPLGCGTAERPAIELDPDDPGLLVYTSGSTGRPKGVMKTHGMILRDALDVGRAARVAPEDRVLLVASLWGGQAQCTTWIALFCGAALMSFPAVENGVTGLAEWMIDKRVSIFISASSLFRHFIKTVGPGTSFPDIRLVKLSADAATREDFNNVLAHFPNAELMHAMGMTEIGHMACMIFARDAVVGEGKLPLGRPFDGVDLRITDEKGSACPTETIGTLSLRLPYLAAGYWRDPELTAKHFFQDPDGARGFRGGDLASIDAEGQIVLAGRKDATHKFEANASTSPRLRAIWGSWPASPSSLSLPPPAPTVTPTSWLMSSRWKASPLRRRDCVPLHAPSCRGISFLRCLCSSMLYRGAQTARSIAARSANGFARWRVNWPAGRRRPTPKRSWREFGLRLSISTASDAGMIFSSLAATR